MALTLEQKLALDKLRKKDGTLSTDDVIEAARNPRNPLHDAGFRWDVNEAAYNDWTNTARSLIREYKLYITVEETTREFEVPGYIRDPNAEPDEKGYKSVKSIKDSREESIASLQNTATTCTGHLNRLKSLSEYFGFDVSFVDEALACIEDYQKYLVQKPRRPRRRPDEPHPDLP